jgi:hypothetical protein
MRVADLMPDAPARIEARLAVEVAASPNHLHLKDFLAARVPPHAIEVQFSGGICQDCFAITKSNGRYTVVWLPLAETFALTVDGQFGPLDIGVHGPALAVFSSV